MGGESESSLGGRPADDAHREGITAAQLRGQVHLVRFEPAHIEFRPAEGAPRDLANRLGQKLTEWTGTRWVVAVSQEEGAPKLEQQESARVSELGSEVARHPLVRAVLDAFPGATIAAVRERFAGGESATEDEVAPGAEGAEDSEEALRLAIKRIDKAAAKGVIHKNQAANRKSRLMARAAHSAAE